MAGSARIMKTVAFRIRQGATRIANALSSHQAQRTQPLYTFPLRTLPSPSLHGCSIPGAINHPCSYIVHPLLPQWDAVILCHHVRGAPTTWRQLSTVAESVVDMLSKKSAEDVENWAKTDLDIKDEDLKIIQTNGISGKVLLHTKKHELVADGMSRGAATEIMMAVEKMLRPEPKTVRFSDIGTGGSTTFKSQTDFKEFLLRQGAAGVRNGDDVIVQEFDELKDGELYTVEFATASTVEKVSSMERAIMLKANQLTLALFRKQNVGMEWTCGNSVVGIPPNFLKMLEQSNLTSVAAPPAT